MATIAEFLYRGVHESGNHRSEKMATKRKTRDSEKNTIHNKSSARSRDARIERSGELKVISREFTTVADFETSNGQSGWQNLLGVTGQAHFTSIGEGNNQDDRDGRNAYIHSIHARVQLDLSPISNFGGGTLDAFYNSTVNMRVLLVVDRQPNGAFPSPISDILSVLGSNDSAGCAYQNLQQNKRFWVLKDKKYEYTRPGGAGGSQKTDAWAGIGHPIIADCNYTFQTPLKVTYQNTTTDIADVVTNSVLAICWCDQVMGLYNTSSSYAPHATVFYVNIRTRFTG